MDAFIEHSPQLYDIGRDIAQVYRNEIQYAKNVKNPRSSSVASGDLKNFKWDIEMTPRGIDLIFYLPKHWYWIEFGRKPTSKNPDTSGPKTLKQAIAEWVDRRSIRLGMLDREKTINAITWKIYHKGYDGKGLLQTALKTTRPLQERFSELVNDILLEDIKKEEI